jgi:molybdenum cofactor cytidylyltransferase
MPERLHGVVVLAAGGSRRLGQSKQLLQHDGQTLVHRAVLAAIATDPFDAVIVVGAQVDVVFDAVRDLPIRRADCSDWHSGMGASLRAGLAVLSPKCEGALIVLCDQPALAADHLGALCRAWRASPERAAASFYAGKLGVPALLPRAWFDAATQISGDRGARDLLAHRGGCVIAIANESLAADIDIAADLSQLR